MPIIKFVKENKEIEVPVGTNLRRAAIQAGINLNCGLNGVGASINKWVNCGGKGMCATCRVLITRGMENTNPMTKREWFQFQTPFHPDPIPCFAYVGHEDTMRLACMVKVNGDIEVESCPPVNLFGENFFS
jgi:ferredoxin